MFILQSDSVYSSDYMPAHNIVCVTKIDGAGAGWQKRHHMRTVQTGFHMDDFNELIFSMSQLFNSNQFSFLFCSLPYRKAEVSFLLPSSWEAFDMNQRPSLPFFILLSKQLYINLNVDLEP